MNTLSRKLHWCIIVAGIMGVSTAAFAQGQPGFSQPIIGAPGSILPIYQPPTSTRSAPPMSAAGSAIPMQPSRILPPIMSPFGNQPGYNYYPYGPPTTYQAESGAPERHHHNPFEGGSYEDIGNGTVIDAGNGQVISTNGLVLYGGYYYGGYCPASTGQNVYPSVYYGYGGMPEYMYNPAVIVTEPAYPQYDTPYAPFAQPTYQVTYNQTNYYGQPAQSTGAAQGASSDTGGGQSDTGSVDDTRLPPGTTAADQDTAPSGSYVSAFADIERAWNDGDIGLIRKHLRDKDTKISVLMKRKYAYSISSDDYAEITRDAFDRLATISFKFTRLRKATNGDVTAYGVHVYQVSESGDDGKSDSGSGTVPFDTNGSSSDTDQNAQPQGATMQKTMYVSYTLHQRDGEWFITMVDSSPDKLVVDADGDDTSGHTLPQIPFGNGRG